MPTFGTSAAPPPPLRASSFMSTATTADDVLSVNAVKSLSFDGWLDRLGGRGQGTAAAAPFDVRLRPSDALRGVTNAGALEYLIETGRNPYIVTADDVRVWKRRLCVTRAQVEQIVALPQRSPEWFVERGPRLTASDMGDAANLAPQWKLAEYGDCRVALLLKKVWDVKEAEKPVDEKLVDRRTNMQRGVEDEDTTIALASWWLRHQYCDVAQQWRGAERRANRMWVHNEGLRVDIDAPWLAASDDGKAHIEYGAADDLDETLVITLEAKAPMRLHVDTQPHYYAQLMAEMNVWRRPDTNQRYSELALFTEFVEDSVDRQTRAEQQLVLHEFDEPFWRNVVLPEAHHFYHGGLVPAFILKERGLLDRGAAAPTLTAYVDVGATAASAPLPAIPAPAPPQAEGDDDGELQQMLRDVAQSTKRKRPVYDDADDAW